MTTETATRERPILFSDAMIRAILAGRKSMTRRLARTFESPASSTGHFIQLSRDRSIETDDRAIPFCPHGQPGDLLWVRERFRIEQGDVCYFTECPTCKLNGHEGEVGWKSPIFMPRWARRITLKITGVRVERLQQITVEDVQAEGCTGSPFGTLADRMLFPVLWNSINGKRAPWDSNPWVWVIEFRRV